MLGGEVGFAAAVAPVRPVAPGVHGVSLIWTHDRDLRRFDGITVNDPFDPHYARGLG